MRVRALCTSLHRHVASMCGGDAAAAKEVAAVAVVGMFARVAHLVFYALNQPFLRTCAYACGLHAAAYVFAGSVFGAWTSPYWGAQ